MKLNRLFIAGLLSVSMLASCNKENNEPNTDSDGQGYMTLQVLGNAAARTEGEKEGNATTEESTINDLDVYLCDDAGIVDSRITLKSNNFNTTQSGARTKPFSVKVGTYRVWVVANSDNSLKVGDNINEHIINWKVYPGGFASQVANPNKFTMVNQINGKDDNAPLITITEDNDFTHPATCDVINLDRLAAKVEVKENTTNSDFIKGVTDDLSAITNMELQGYKMINVANKIWGVQHWVKIKSSMNADKLFDNRLNLKDLGVIQTELQNALSSARDVEIKENTNPREYTVVKDNYNEIGYYDATTPKGVSYVPEYSPISISASNLDEATTNNTTGVVYQYKATVTGSDKIAGDNCFYCYDGNYFATLAELSNTYTNFLSVDLAGELDAAYKATDRQIAISNFRAKYNIKVYTEGIVYYTYYIKDENYSLDGTPDNKLYSIMRNTWYVLNVNSLKRIGEDIPGGWEPDNKIDTNEVFMVVEVKVNPWVLSSTDIDLQ